MARPALEALVRAVDDVGRFLVERTKSYGAAIDAEHDRIAKKSAAAAAQIDEMLSTAAKNAVEASQAALTQFEGLTGQYVAANNIWNEELKLGLDALKLGALDRTEFIRQYGDDIAVIDGKNKALKFALDQVDFDVYKKQVQDLIGDLASHQLSIEQIIERVGALGGKFAEGIASMIERWKQGQIGFAELAAQIQRLQEQFPGSDLDALLKIITTELQQQDKDGFI